MIFAFEVVQTCSFRNQIHVKELKNYWVLFLFLFFNYILARYSHIVTSSCFAENAFSIWRYQQNKKDSDGHADLQLQLYELLKWKFMLLGWWVHYLVQFHC